MQEETFKLVFFAWLEIPYFIDIDYEAVYPVNYKPNIRPQLRVKFRNDLLRVATSNKWTRYDDTEERPEETFRIPHYVTESDIPIIKDLVKTHRLPYLHIEKTETVVELLTELDVPKSLYESITQYGDIAALIPQVNFFNTEVLPKIAVVVDTYRIATLPALRYKVGPISENIIEAAFIQIQDHITGKTIQQWKHGFDTHNHGRSMQHHTNNLGVQSRFDSFINSPDSIEFELQFCSSYYLFHMRRWTEALVIASGVVDSLVQKAIFDNLPVQQATDLWKINRTKYKDLFNNELPNLGFTRLCDEDKLLWDSFVESKKRRGSVAHATINDSFTSTHQETVLNDLRTLYSVARWLSIKNGRPWQLDVEGITHPLF